MNLNKNDSRNLKYNLRNSDNLIEPMSKTANVLIGLHGMGNSQLINLEIYKKLTNFYILTRVLVAFLRSTTLSFFSHRQVLDLEWNGVKLELTSNADDVLANVLFVIAGITTLAAAEVLTGMAILFYFRNDEIRKDRNDKIDKKYGKNLKNRYISKPYQLTLAEVAEVCFKSEETRFGKRRINSHSPQKEKKSMFRKFINKQTIVVDLNGSDTEVKCYRKPLPSILGINLKFNRNSIWNSSHRNHVKEVSYDPFFLLLYFLENLCCLQQAVAEAEYFELKPGVGAEIEVGYLNHLKHNALITGSPQCFLIS
ncbi:hypothetical protein BpHYR1_037435 [Brachionus plicatilis]|uniref:Uncharacterized protein n=1 Tax=Brachionus plicatilis TaxID=10195 RepID=A0A3M7QTI1_BRAPC|nr:hypothetical protein BpHYR1_037435 [Brachionus plicatilis]